MSGRVLACSLVVLGVGVLAGCENSMQDMYDQPKNKPLSESTLWADGRAARPKVTDTVAFSAGTRAEVSSGRLGVIETDPGHVVFTRESLVRGRERYGIFCAPCHGAVGDGNGYIAARGFPHPPTFHSDRLRSATDAYLFDVITQGYGVMYPYADRVRGEDRWSIVAYIRALQFSQHATLSDVPDAERTRLLSTPIPGAPR